MGNFPKFLAPADLKKNLSWNTISVKLFAPKSGCLFCPAISGSPLFANVIYLAYRVNGKKMWYIKQ